MEIHDPLYGRFELPDLSSALCTLPEVRRLSQIRLLNSITPTLATLSELRRYAHTLGVLRLFSLWKKSAGLRFSKKDVDALEVAIILHDVATPPFGHLFEYVLKEMLNWDHESAARSTLLKDFSSASTAQQIYAGKTPKVLDHIERLGVDVDIVIQILSKKHNLSTLIFGVLDFDNLDNVVRMCWALGNFRHKDCSAEIELLASNLSVSPHGELQLPSKVVTSLVTWATMRRAAYEIIVFDQQTVASQALLTHTIKQGLQRGLISTEDWLLNDESLLAKLSVDVTLKQIIDRQYLGQLPSSLLCVQYSWGEESIFRLERSAIEQLVMVAVSACVNMLPWVYAFKERGSFEKKVGYVNEHGEQISFGKTSQSLVISVFLDRSLNLKQSRLAASACIDLFAQHGLSDERMEYLSLNGKETLANNRRLDHKA